MPTYTLQSTVTVELDIRKSRFIGIVMPVADRDAAMALLEQLRAENPAATHVCWALLAGGQSGMSDDGEPSGTAGRPMLEVLRHHDLDGVLAAVIRYYGGIKLGAGGLVRAYTDAVASAMQIAERVERIAYTEFAIEVDYADETRVRHWLDQQGYALAGSEYGMKARLMMRLPASAEAGAREQLRDVTHGRGVFDDPEAS